VIDILEEYLNATASWARQNGTDKYGQPTFAYQTIACNVNAGMKYIKSATGEQIVSDQTVITTANVQPGDRISTDEGVTYRPVLHISPMNDFYNETIGKKVYI